MDHKAEYNSSDPGAGKEAAFLEHDEFVTANLREMQDGYPEVSPDTPDVRCDGFGASSLDIAMFA